MDNKIHNKPFGTHISEAVRVLRGMSDKEIDDINAEVRKQYNNQPIPLELTPEEICESNCICGLCEKDVIEYNRKHCDYYEAADKALKAQLQKLKDRGDMYVKTGGISDNLQQAAADPEGYIVDGYGASWERDAPIFGYLKRLGYIRAIPLSEYLKEKK